MTKKKAVVEKVVEDVVLLPIDAIVPYWRNPRSVGAATIAKLMFSIERFGYQAPIIVDQDNVIIAGHTRLLAMRRLGWTEVPVLVTDMPPHLAREYRIVDNRSAEWSTWDRKRLAEELRRFTDTTTIAAFFPELDLTGDSLPELELKDLEMPREKRVPGEIIAASRMMVCPHCYCEFELEAVCQPS